MKGSDDDIMIIDLVDDDSLDSHVGDIERSHTNFLWTIPKFSSKCKHYYVQNYPPILEDYEWMFSLYPYGLAEKKAITYMSLSIVQMYNYNPIKAIFKFSVLNNKDEVVHDVVLKNSIFFMKKEYKIAEFARRDFILDSSNDILSSGDTLRIQIDIYTDQSTLEKEEIVKFSNCHNMFEAYLNNQHLSDVTFLVDKREIFAHKIVLMARSPVFQSMFSYNMQENDTKTVAVDNVTYDVFLEFLRFLYSKKVDNIDNIAKELFIVAEMYSVEGLKGICMIFIKKNLNIYNAFEYLNFARSYKSLHLKTTIVKYIQSNFHKVTHKFEVGTYNCYNMWGHFIKAHEKKLT